MRNYAELLLLNAQRVIPRRLELDVSCPRQVFRMYPRARAGERDSTLPERAVSRSLHAVRHRDARVPDLPSARAR